MAEGGASVWVPLLLSAIGSGVSYASSEDAKNKSASILCLSQKQQQESTKKAENIALEGAQKYDPTSRLAAQDEAERTAANSLGTALTQAESKLPNTDVQGKVSDEYLVDKGKATTERMARSMRLAQAMARMRAPNDLRFDESIDNADVAGRVSSNLSDARNALEAGSLGASAVQPNSGAALASGLLSAGGTAYSGRTSRPKRYANYGIYGTDSGE